MKNQTALDALSLQHRRLTEMLRTADGGIWWSSDAIAEMEAEKIKAQSDVICADLDELNILINKIVASSRQHSKNAQAAAPTIDLSV